MARSSAKNSAKSNRQRELDFGRNRSALRTQAAADPVTKAISETARRLWPGKVAANLAAVAGVSDRRAEQILAADTATSADVITSLLWSEHGREFLFSVMALADRKPIWWRAFEREARLAELREIEIEAQRKRAALERGEIA